MRIHLANTIEVWRDFGTLETGARKCAAPLIRGEGVIDGYTVRVPMVDVTAIGSGGWDWRPNRAVKAKVLPRPGSLSTASRIANPSLGPG